MLLSHDKIIKPTKLITVFYKLETSSMPLMTV